MPIVIFGAPRSGLRLVAGLLHRQGVHLAGRALCVHGGDSAGEALLDERILWLLGGAWDAPPAPSAGWERTDAAAALRREATTVADALSGWEPWAWTSAAATFTRPLWQSILPELATIVVVRNPLEVAWSLRAAHGCSIPFALGLVRRYQQAIAASPPSARRVVTHFGALLREPTEEAARILSALGIGPFDTVKAVDGAAPPPRPCGPRFSLLDLDRFGVPADIVAAYADLCGAACHADEGDGLPLTPESVARLGEMVGAATPPAPPVESFAAAIGALRGEFEGLRRDLADRDDALQEALDDLRFLQGHIHVPPARQLYRNVVKRSRAIVSERVPEGSRLLVVSKGDDELLRHRGIESWHFPRDPRGGYAGWHPGSDLAAIAHLETLRALGATHLLLPETYDWWLDAYPAFAEHLRTGHRLVESRPGTGKLYELLPRPVALPPDESPGAIVRRISDGLGRPARVLDLTGDSRAASLLGDASPWRVAPDRGVPLPYIDSSVDVVAVADAAPELLAEARRVAALAVIDLAGGPRVEWSRPIPARSLPSASIVIPVFNQWEVTRQCLVALRATLPDSPSIEILVVDDGSTDATPSGLAAWAEGEPRLRLLRNASNLGFVGSCNAAAAAATGDVLVFVNNDTVPLPGWLEALLGTFSDVVRAGAVGGKLLFPDGRLQEAGGVIFSDASAFHFGRGEADATAAPFDRVRPVDYVSGALMATPRRLFASLGGFDPTFAPGYYEDTDYCFRLRESGYGVWYQPAAAAVHHEGATAGTDEAAGMKRHQAINRERFRERHAAALALQPDPVPHPHGAGWESLVRRGRGRPS